MHIFLPSEVTPKIDLFSIRKSYIYIQNVMTFSCKFQGLMSLHVLLVHISYIYISHSPLNMRGC